MMLERTGRRVLALMIALALAVCGPALAEKTATAYVRADGAAVYDASGRVLGTLPADSAVTVTGVKGDICRVERGGNTAYMMKADLTASPAAAAQADEASDGADEPGGEKRVKAYVSHDGAAVYRKNGDVAGTLGLNTEVTVTGMKGGACRISGGGKSFYMRASDLSAEKVSTGRASVGHSDGTDGPNLKPARGTAKEMDWWTSDIQMIFDRGVVAQITDVETGLTWREKRFGGTNHADCQPLTAADTAAMKKAYGGKWSWDRRAVFVTIDGINYAASINGMPHGSGSIKDNDFDGHHCIHFTNSRTHGSNSVCPKHQAAIRRAASTRL